MNGTPIAKVPKDTIRRLLSGDREAMRRLREKAQEKDGHYLVSPLDLNSIVHESMMVRQSRPKPCNEC